MADSIIKIEDLNPIGGNLKGTAQIPISQDKVDYRVSVGEIEQSVLTKVSDRYLEKDEKIPNDNLTFGEVKEGDVNVVSGNEVYNYISKNTQKVHTLKLNQISTNRVMTEVAILQNASINVVVKYKKISLKENKISVRTYTDLKNGLTATSVLTDKVIYSKEWAYGQALMISVPCKADTSNIAITVEGEDIEVESITVTEGDSYTYPVLKYTHNLLDNRGYYVLGKEGQQSKVWLSKGVVVNKDWAKVILVQSKPMVSFKVDIIYDMGNGTHDDIIEFETIYEGSGLGLNSQGLEIPFKCTTKSFRVRVTNLNSSQEVTYIRSLSIIELDNKPLYSYSNYSHRSKRIMATIEDKTLDTKNYRNIAITNNSSTANLIVTSHLAELQVKPKATLNINPIYSVKYRSDRGVVDMNVIYSQEVIKKDYEGIDINTSIVNYRGYSIIRPFPMAKRIVWGTKRDDKELWRFELDEDFKIVKEILLQTFEYPIIDIFVTSTKAILISTGDMYAPDGIEKSRFKLFRSEYPSGNWGEKITEIVTPGISVWFPREGIDQVGSAIIYGEYAIDKNTVSIMRSIDDGKTWSAQKTLQVPSETRHIHTVKVDRLTGGVYVTTGDQGEQLKWFFSKDSGNTFEELTLERNQNIKILGMDISQDKIICVTDSPGVDNYIIEFDKNDLNNRKFLYKSQNVFFGLVRVDNRLVAYELTQHAGNSQVQNGTYKIKIICSENEGKTWETICEWEASSASGNGGFRYASMPDRDGNIYFRTDRAVLEGHYFNQNSIVLRFN